MTCILISCDSCYAVGSAAALGSWFVISGQMLPECMSNYYMLRIPSHKALSGTWLLERHTETQLLLDCVRHDSQSGLCNAMLPGCAVAKWVGGAREIGLFGGGGSRGWAGGRGGGAKKVGAGLQW